MGVCLLLSLPWLNSFSSSLMVGAVLFCIRCLNWFLSLPRLNSFSSTQMVGARLYCVGLLNNLSSTLVVGGRLYYPLVSRVLILTTSVGVEVRALLSLHCWAAPFPLLGAVQLCFFGRDSRNVSVWFCPLAGGF